MGSNSSVPEKDAEQVVAPLEHLEKPPKQIILSQAQATPSAKGPSNPTALRNVSVELMTSSSEQSTASDKETTSGESSLQPAGPVEGPQEYGDWLSREVERLAKKELDLEERENHLRERRLEINKEKQRLSAKEQDIMLRMPKLELEVELKKKEFDSEKKRLQKRYDWLAGEGIRQQRGESWLDGKPSQLYWGSNTSASCPYPTSPLQQSEWERKRRLQTEEKAKDQKYRLELQLKREVEELKREDERLSKKQCRIEREEAEVNREVKILDEKNVKLVMEEDGLEEKEKEIGKTSSEQSGDV